MQNDERSLPLGSALKTTPKTVEEIAQATGFSITTVRFVIGGQAEKYRISAKTRQLIEDYIAIHGYSLNHAARTLKLRRSETIGFVVPDLSNAFFARVMAGLETLCRQDNLLLLTASSHEDPALENRAITNLLARGVDGLAIAPCQASTLPQLAKSKPTVAVVLFDRDYGSTLFPTVASDNYHGSLEMAREMIKAAKGDASAASILTEPIYFLCGQAELPSIRDRIRGFSEAYEHAGIAFDPAQIRRDHEDSLAAGQRMMKSLIESDKDNRAPHAFMCSSLLVLEGALWQIKTQLGSIDKTLLIGTFDDYTLLDLLPNRLFSIRQDETLLAQKIYARLSEPKKSRISLRDIVSGTLIRRNL